MVLRSLNFTRPTSEPAKQVRRLPVLAVVVALAGCGGGGEGSGDAQSTTKTGSKGGASTDKKKKKLPEETVIRGFQVKVVSSSQAMLTADLTRAAEVSLAARKIGADGNRERVGKVDFGRKPQGRVAITWNLRVAGKPLAPGRYQVTLRAKDVGKSKPVQITVPSG